MGFEEYLLLLSDIKSRNITEEFGRQFLFFIFENIYFSISKVHFKKIISYYEILIFSNLEINEIKWMWTDYLVEFKIFAGRFQVLIYQKINLKHA